LAVVPFDVSADLAGAGVADAVRGGGDVAASSDALLDIVLG
jgi:hypothetical protein